MLGSLGQYTSPIWAARLVATAYPSSVGELGPLDTNDVTPIRLDRYLRDGDGGIYWWLTTVLPGFRQFRFPAKLFTFTAFGIAALAGIGWDSLATGRHRGTMVLTGLLLLITLGVLATVLAERGPILSGIARKNAASPFGPLDVDAGYAELVRSLAHGAMVLALTLTLILLARRRFALAGVIAMIGVTADLAVANARHVTTVPQALFEGEPEVARLIKEAEQKNPSPGPFRVHRMPQWNPAVWFKSSSPDRVADFVTWERATLQPKYGITLGIEYTHTMGVAELYDYEWFFGGFPYTVRNQTARNLGIASGQKVVYFPRRSFDMWNTRYFVLPEFPNNWLDEFRGYAAFLHETELIYPPESAFEGPGKTDKIKTWMETQDFQIRRNLQAYPRAWVVHEARGLPEMDGKTRNERSGPMQEILYDADPIWNDSTLAARDPHRLVWIDSQELPGLHGNLTGQSPRPTETVKVSYPDPQHVEIEARLETPGLVVLADVHYPGWTLTIDDQPATILRVNRLMRGAAVGAGVHHLRYAYQPSSFFKFGGPITLGGLAITALLGLGCLVRSRSSRLDQ